MRTRNEHFIYGLLGNSLRIMESKDAERLLSEKNFLYLRDIGKTMQPANGDPIVNTFETEQIVSYTFLEQKEDDHGRTSIWNHTILIKYRDAFFSLIPELTPFVIHSLENHKNPMPPLEVEL